MKKQSKKRIKETKIKNVCFVIMPYGGWFDIYYDNIYRPAIEKAGLNSLRADDLYKSSEILKDILENTKKAKLILADLTGKNPNVFYELGLAHALSKPVILITQSLEDIPADLRSLKIIQYDKNFGNWGNLLKTNIIAVIKELLKSPNNFVPSIFLKTKEKKGGIAITPLEKEIVGLKQEIELIRKRQGQGTNRLDAVDTAGAIRMSSSMFGAGSHAGSFAYHLGEKKCSNCGRFYSDLTTTYLTTSIGPNSECPYCGHMNY